MPLWGSSPGNEKRPEYLNASEKRECYASSKGWEYAARGNGNDSADPEVLVAIGDLADKIGAPSIVDVYFTASDYDIGDTITYVVVYNELVDVTNGATVTVTSTGATNPLTLTAAEQNGVNRVEFTVTAPNENGATLTPAGVSITGTIVGSESEENASLTINSAIASAADTSAIAASNSSSSSSESTEAGDLESTSSTSRSSSSSVETQSSSSSSSSTNSSSSSSVATKSSSSSSSSTNSSSSSTVEAKSSSSSSSSSTAAENTSSSSSTVEAKSSSSSSQSSSSSSEFAGE